MSKCEVCRKAQGTESVKVTTDKTMVCCPKCARLVRAQVNGLSLSDYIVDEYRKRTE